MSHGILIPKQIAASNIDAWTRSAVSASDVDNGNIVSGTGLTDVWMVYEPELVWTGSYRGLNPDVREFYTAAGLVFSVFKPELDDIITLTADNLVTGTGAALGSYAIATNSTGGLKLVWTVGWTSSTHVFALQCIKVDYISIGTGAVDNQRVTAYDFQVVHL
jgi:hypothetical protein